MKIFHENPRQTVDCIYNLLTSFLQSKKYGLQFLNQNIKIGSITSYQLQRRLLEKCLYEIQSMKLMNERECLSTVVKLTPELQYLIHNANSTQKLQMKTLIENCFTQLRELHSQDKYPNRNLLVQTPKINLQKVVEIGRVKEIQQELKAAV